MQKLRAKACQSKPCGSSSGNGTKNKRAETVPSTVAHYENVAAKFLDFLGDRADADIGEVTMSDILAFRAHESLSFAPKTVNHSIKYLRMVFKVAKRDGLIADNPAGGL